MDNGTMFLPNNLYPLEKEMFRLYYTSASTDQQTIDIYIIDSFGQMQQVSFSFNNDSREQNTQWENDNSKNLQIITINH